MHLPIIPQHLLYPENLSEAAKIQSSLSQQVITLDQYEEPDYIAGIDVSNNLYDPNQKIYAAAVNLNYQTLQIFETATAEIKQTLAYRPGFLGFREVPAIVAALKKLPTMPNILMVDGHGISHPRRFGIATHLGVLLNTPTIGVAKSILIGKPKLELGLNVGDHVSLFWREEIIGILLRTKKRANPLIISSGHRVSLASAVKIVMACLKGYRLPEPTRQAHNAANAFRIKMLQTL